MRLNRHSIIVDSTTSHIVIVSNFFYCHSVGTELVKFERNFENEALPDPDDNELELLDDLTLGAIVLVIVKKAGDKQKHLTYSSDVLYVSTARNHSSNDTLSFFL